MPTRLIHALDAALDIIALAGLISLLGVCLHLVMNGAPQ